MKFRVLVIVFTVCSLALLPTPCKLRGQDYVIQYDVHIDSDDSATWTITQVSDLNGTIDTWDGFQEKILSLVDDAVSLTQREMAIDLGSLEITTIGDAQFKTTKYIFTWLNSSVAQEGKISFGDVFLVNDFFDKLYGNGTLQVTYPPAYTVQSVSPTPNERDDSLRILVWLGTQFFISGKPSITLAAISPSPTPEQTANDGGWQFLALVGLASALAVGALLAGFYEVRRRKKKALEQNVALKLSEAGMTESEEQKIIRILRASGGSAFQSAITERLRFSKAKTSQLLTALEKKGVVRRYKKGRDKIVTLAERGKSD